MALKDIPLLISLVFGAGQCIFGAAVLAHGIRAGRWRRTGIFLLMLLGGWALCSGAAELVVSGLAVATRLSGVPTPGEATSVRQAADGVLVLVSVALLVPLALYSMWKRAMSRETQPRDSTEQKD